MEEMARCPATDGRVPLRTPQLDGIATVSHFNPLMDTIDIYRTAKLLLDQYGADASVHAAMRADQLIESGDVQGVHVWKRVLKAIEELTSSDPGGAVH